MHKIEWTGFPLPTQNIVEECVWSLSTPTSGWWQFYHQIINKLNSICHYSSLNTCKRETLSQLQKLGQMPARFLHLRNLPFLSKLHKTRLLKTEIQRTIRSRWAPVLDGYLQFKVNRAFSHFPFLPSFFLRYFNYDLWNVLVTYYASHISYHSGRCRCRFGVYIFLATFI